MGWIACAHEEQVKQRLLVSQIGLLRVMEAGSPKPQKTVTSASQKLPCYMFLDPSV